MALEGFLEEFGLADILQLIYFQKKTGVLNIEGNLDNIELSFIDGNITGLKSDRRLESNRLGKILLNKGLITEKDLFEAVEKQKAEGIKVGSYFAKNGLVAKEVLTEIIQDQIIETIVQVFTWKEGRYEFIPQGVASDKEMPINLDTEHLLMDGLRIVDEWSLVEGKLDLNSVYKKISEPLPGEITETEHSVLQMVGHDRDVVAIINSSPIGDFETAKALIALEEKGIIKPLEEPKLMEGDFAIARDIGPGFYALFAAAVLLVLIFVVRGNLHFKGMLNEFVASYQLQMLRSDVDRYRVISGRLPAQIEEVSRNETDRWGNPYLYRLNNDGFVIFSTGKDGVEGTEDDIY